MMYRRELGLDAAYDPVVIFDAQNHETQQNDSVRSIRYFTSNLPVAKKVEALDQHGALPQNLILFGRQEISKWLDSTITAFYDQPINPILQKQALLALYIDASIPGFYKFKLGRDESDSLQSKRGQLCQVLAANIVSNVAAPESSIYGLLLASRPSMQRMFNERLARRTTKLQDIYRCPAGKGYLQEIGLQHGPQAQATMAAWLLNN